MNPAPNSEDMRRSPRAQLRMPVRLRWQSSFGMRLEVTETIDVSKEGMLILRSDAHGIGSRAWVAFPFEPAHAGAAQPETPAVIVRVEPEKAGGYRVALQLELPKREIPPPTHIDRRKAPRVPFALPIFVRPKETPWPEESMTRDISKSGALLETSHVYRVGDLIRAKIPWGSWSDIGEIPGRVVRIESRRRNAFEQNAEIGSNAILRSVAVEWMPEEEPEPTGSKEMPPQSSPGSVPRFKLL